MAKLKCAECGREIQNAYRLNGKVYGYNCYKKKLAIIYKQWEDEKNSEYSAKCFAAMQIFHDKKNNSFHDSVCKQWNDCKKLTAKQLECIVDGFTLKERIGFWCIWFSFTNDEDLKRSIPSWIESELYKNNCVGDYVENEAVCNCFLHNKNYKNGFYFCHDIEDEPEKIFIQKIKHLQEDKEDEYIKILRVVKAE